MRTYQALTLGYVPTRRDTFPDPADAIAQRDPIRAKVEELLTQIGNVRLVDIDWLNEEGLLVENADAEKVEAKFRAEKVDAIFIALCNFGQEEVIAKLAKALGKPVLLWGLRDPMPPSDLLVNRQTDSQCGLFAASRALLRYGVPFTYIENCWLDAPVLAKGLSDFVRVATVVKAMTNLRIGQISTRPRQFLSVKVNESELLERFGIEVTTFNENQMLDRVRSFLNGRTADTDAMVDSILSRNDCSALEPEMLRKIAAFELAMLEMAEEFDCSAFASECWDVLPKELGIRPCFAFGDLTDRGLPVACETDVHGAITSVLLTAAMRSSTPGFLADVTIRHPKNENAELLWHCGPFPVSLAKQAKPPIVDCHGQWEIKGGAITVARFDAHAGKYQLFCGLSKGTDGPPTNGNYIWIETEDWPRWERKLIYGPYIHHVVGIHGDATSILKEACRYIPGLCYDAAD